MRTALLAFTTTCLVPFFAATQPSFTLASGITTDINNNATRKFVQLPFCFQFQYGRPTKGVSMLVKFQYSFSGTKTYTASAYTLNASLQPQIQLRETVKPQLTTAGVGMGIHLATFNHASSLTLELWPFVLCNQNMPVTYTPYDKINYTIQNPDFGSNLTSWGSAAGLTYQKPVKNSAGAFVASLNVQSAVVTKHNAYPNSFGSVSPLTFTIGYSFGFKKHKK